MRKSIFTFLLLFFYKSPTYAQSISCSDFCVTAIETDSVNQGQTNIQIYMGGAASNFINYPVVSCVIDANGDTLGTGSLYYFGQIGNTTQTYFVVGGSATFIAGQSYTIFFQFDTVWCALPFPCPTQNINEFFMVNSPLIYPNPGNGKFIFSMDSSIFTPGDDLEIINSLGEVVGKYQTYFRDTELDLSGNPHGIYFLKVHYKGGYFTTPIVLED